MSNKLFPYRASVNDVALKYNKLQTAQLMYFVGEKLIYAQVSDDF